MYNLCALRSEHQSDAGMSFELSQMNRDFDALLRAISALPSDPDDWSEPDDLRGLAYIKGSAARRVIFTTKIHSLMHFGFGNRDVPGDVSFVGRYGVITKGHTALLGADRAFDCTEQTTYFIGDVDPMDLTVFASLSAAFPTTKFVFMIADAWLQAAEGHRLSDTSSNPPTWRRLPTIALSAFERAHLLELERVLSLESIVGSVGAAILHAGYKLEFEGAANPAFYNSAWPGWMQEFMLRGTPDYRHIELRSPG